MKSTLARITLLSFLFLLFTPHFTSAELKTFIKEYTYQASEFDSKASGRILALEQVKRLLLEELGIYLESNTEVRNYQLTKDQITTLTAGIVSAEVIDEKWDGKTYYLKAKLLADPKEVAQSINELRQDKQKTKELEDIRKKSDEQVKEIARLKKELEKDQAAGKEPSGKADAKKVEQYTNAVTKLTAKDWLLKGLMLDSSKAAIEAYDKAIELDPEYEEAYLHRAKVYLDLSTNYEKAIDDINNAIKYEPQRRRDGKYGSLAEKYSIRAKAYLKLDDYEKAFKDLELAISLDYVKALFLLNPIKWNEKEFEDFVNKFPNDYRVFMFHGAFIGGGFGIKGIDVIVQRIADYKKALDLNPNSAICKYLLGIEYDSFLYEPRTKSVSEYSAVVGDVSWDTPVMFFTQAIQLKPMQELLFNIYESRAYVYFRDLSYEKSIEDISRAIEINPEYAEGYRFRAHAYNTLGKYRAAIEDYSVAIKVKTVSVDP
jgi:tetratricopeptide (TPR) repeat protein